MSIGTIQELDYEECLELLQVGRFARVAFEGEDQLELLPVNYAYADGVILIRTSENAGLASIVERRFVLEADHHDDTYQTGWSVVVRGSAARATKELLESFGGRLPNSWAGSEGNAVHIAIMPNELRGRRVRAFPR
ncbi:pyridoxamine 5'-phosphate oxidase family protein [Aeromicrobium duanguangcaii]|uniref:Pyridoxamine 5'-phosphate oxidase family protein n=1 Tax=Aeromicrobium duanguangcaii TaxID=2968086 RepID=A0ABY5KET1_9ACTN|nr:pyridoxamine 5'-phosphate oxidase family protein [Aeromicrobium duanguangcaii]MCD9154086.1 pyridoxamine 5'-phosphate oxidase family protein [Aeromicrobium duanguangcaii]MCL3837822.1 pyridoxamine 5'-phosphate oxidase family protein [Aeromicrobium duanguangcaii]UUI68840.1 pyridoxamine 5'-phosphate oxidase family protein [Aeromicrobium duanguangcaii]